MARLFSASAVLSASLALITPATAQTGTTTADVIGVVHDQSQASLPNAQITIVNTGTNLTRMVLTELDGRFAIPTLPPGVYALRVERQGFSPHVRENVAVTLGSLIELDITLQIAGLTEQISVEAQPPLLDIRRTGLSTVVTSEQIDDLPINGRNFLSFSLLTPGVSSDRTPQQGASATSGLTFGGQSARLNNITVDGLDNNDGSTGGVRATFSQEAVREFQVLSNSFSAEFGKAAGGVVNIVTKSGTNELFGDAFVFFRDEQLNAKDHFEQFAPNGDRIDVGKAPYSQKQFGATMGGPIRKDKSFFFLSFERLDVTANNFVTIDDHSPVSLSGQVVGTAASILRDQGFAFETGHVPFSVTSNAFLAKIDHLLTPQQPLTVRFSLADNLDENIEPWGGLVAKSRGAFLESRDRMLSASHTAVLSPTTVSELRGQVAYRDQNVLSLDPSCDGRCDRNDEGGPTVEVVGVANVGRQRFTPQPRETIRYQALQTLSNYRGSHQLKAGVDYNFVATLSGALPLHFGGRYIFTALPAIPGLVPAPISSIQAVALGLPAAYVQGYGDPNSTPDYHDLSLFGEDNWRLKPNLSVRLGLRYQRQFWPSSSFNMPAFGKYSLPSDNDNVAPRLAASWDPFKDGKTSVNGAYGLFFGSLITGVFGVSDILTGATDGVRTEVLAFPRSIAAWRAPGRRLPETESFPSVGFFPDPQLETPYAHHASFGINRELRSGTFLGANLVYVRGFNQLGILDYNPVVPSLGPGRRPNDVIDRTSGIAVPGSSASILQYTSLGESWYRGLTVSLTHRGPIGPHFMASYTLSRADDTSADFQTSTIPEDMGRGRDPNNPAGLPIGFDPRREKGLSLEDQRHRFMFSGSYVMPAGIELATVVTLASGRPFNILAGTDLNGDGNGGAFPTDRARTVPTDPSTSVTRNSGTLPGQATVDLRASRRFSLARRSSIQPMLELFNLFNRTNFTEVNNIFGVGPFPRNPLTTYGQFEKAGPPRQVQLAVKWSF